MIDKVITSAPLDSSDHLCLVWDYIFYSRPYQIDPSIKRNYWKGDYAAMARLFEEMDWKSLIQDQDIIYIYIYI